MSQERKPHPDWLVFCPGCYLEDVCKEWKACPSECTEPMPKWFRKAHNIQSNCVEATGSNSK